LSISSCLCKLILAMDISADLDELGRTPVAVICSGAKAILDLPRTLEYLETKGVTVTTMGGEGVEIPAFYSRESGVKVLSLYVVADIVSVQFSID